MTNKKVPVIVLSAAVLVLTTALPVEAGFFASFLTDPGLSEYNVSVNSDIDKYLFGKVWMELNSSETRPIRNLIGPLVGHYGDGNFLKMEKKMQWLMNASSPFAQKEFARKREGYKLYLIKKYNLTATCDIKLSEVIK